MDNFLSWDNLSKVLVNLDNVLMHSVLVLRDFTKTAKKILKKKKRRDRYIRKMNRFRANKKLKKLN